MFHKFKLLMTIIVGFIIVGNIVNYIFNYSDIEKQNQYLIAEFDKIQHPEGTEEIKKGLLGKGIRKYFSAKYRYTINQQDLDSHYRKEFLKHGWVSSAGKDINLNGVEHLKGNCIIVFRLKEDNIYWISIYYKSDS